MRTPTACLCLALCLLLFGPPARAAQAPAASPNQPGQVVVRATTPTDLRAWDSTIDRMVRGRQLVVVDSRADPDIAGRRHETLAQYHQGIPVYGSSLSRETAQGVAVSILGTVFDDISTDTAPSLTAGQAVAALIDTAGGRLVGDAPQLVVFPMLDGTFRLAYRATMSDMRTYIVDAMDGGVLWSFDEARTQAQGQVGVGTGVLGDQKKMSTSQVAGVFRAFDQLRPAPIRTFDTRGSEAAFNRLIQPPGAAVDADFSVDADNTWADPPVVDTHVHTGWFEDYLFKQHNWTSVDNRGSAITAAVHTGLVNNAFFTPPPFGADGRGMFVYGRTTAGVPITALDTIAHEMMHGVTDAALRQRTGSGLLDALFIDRFGPTSMNFNGSSFPCDTTVVVLADGRRLPLVCNAGRFVLVSGPSGRDQRSLLRHLRDRRGILPSTGGQRHPPRRLQERRGHHRLRSDSRSRRARVADRPAVVGRRDRLSRSRQPRVQFRGRRRAGYAGQSHLRTDPAVAAARQ